MAFARKHWLAMAVFSAATLTCVWFAASFVLDLIYFNDPRHQDEALRAWMTPRYIVMSYDLPRPIVAEVLDLPPDGSRLKMDTIAADLGLTLDELTERVRAAAELYRAGDQ